MDIEQGSVKSRTNSTIVHDSHSLNLESTELRRSALEQPHVQFEENKNPIRPESTLDQKLLAAAQNNERNELQLMLSSNLDIDISIVKNQKLFTLLHFATFNNHYETIFSLLSHYEAYLIRKGLNSYQNIKQYVNLQTSDGFSAIHFAAYRGNIKLMEYLFDKGANILQTNEHGMNIMHISAQGDQPVSVVFAHQKGIPISSLDNKGGSPLHWSCFYGCEQSTIYLLSLLPEKAPYTPLNTLDQQLLSPLHLAVMSGNTRLVKKLLISGADKNLRGKDNKTPADVAIENEYHNIHQMLVKKENNLVNYYNIRQGFNRQRKHIAETLRFLILYFLVCGTFSVFVLRYEELPTHLYHMAWLCLAGIVLIYFIFLVATDPGYMKQGKQNQLLKLLKTYECYEVCPYCCVVKLPRSKHCDICQRCVMVYDHHCPWINNCIGTRNHGMFIIFILLLVVTISYTVTMTFIELLTYNYSPPYLDQISPFYKDILRYIALIGSIVIGIIFTIALVLLVYTQLVNLFSGKTTLERQFRNQNFTRFAFKINPSTISQKTSSTPSYKTSLIESNRKPKLSYSIRNCLQMCCFNRYEFAKKERAISLQ